MKRHQGLGKKIPSWREREREKGFPHRDVTRLWIKGKENFSRKEIPIS